MLNKHIASHVCLTWLRQLVIRISAQLHKLGCRALVSQLHTAACRTGDLPNWPPNTIQLRTVLILIKSQRERREHDAPLGRPFEVFSTQQAEQLDWTVSPTTQESLSTLPSLGSAICSIPFSAIKTQPKQHVLVAQIFWSNSCSSYTTKKN